MKTRETYLVILYYISTITLVFHYNKRRLKRCTLVMAINTLVEQEAAHSSSLRASVAYKSVDGANGFE